MLDEEKTKQELIAELTSLRLKRSVWEKQEDKGMTSDQTLHEALEWKDFLLGLYERSFDLSDEALYGYVLDFVVQLTGSLVGFCHLVAEDQKSIVLTTWNNEALKNCAAVYNTHYPVDQAGNWVDCLRLQRPVVYNEFSDAPNRKGLPAGHNPIRRFMSVPVIEQGKVRIIIGVGNNPEAYTEQDVLNTEVVSHNLQTILDRRHAERKLRESEERLSLTLDAARDGVWDWNIPQGNGYASPRYYTMLGYDHNEFSMNSDTWWTLIHPDDIEEVRRSINTVTQVQSMDQGDAPAVEFRMKKKTGGWCWILARGKVVTWDGDGHPVRMAGTHSDITERKLAEEALRESEGKFKDLVEKSIAGVYLIQDNLFKYVNATFAEIFGYGVDEMTGNLGPKDVMFADDLPLVEENIRKRTSGEMKDIHYGFRIRSKNGEIKYVEVYSSLTSYQGKPAVIGTLLDLTEKKRAEETLRQREAMLQSVFTATPIGLCIMKDRVFQSANKAWYNIFGYSEADIIKHTTRMLYENEDEYERVGRELVSGLSQSGFVSIRTRLRRKDGVLRDATVAASPLQPEDLSRGMVVTIEDITDHNRAEEELKESQRRLADIIDFLPDATLVVDLDGKILAWNRAMETMTGVKQQDMLGKGNYEYALPFYGTRRPILIDLALCRDQSLEKQYTAIRRWEDTLSGEAHTPNLPPGDIHLSATASVLRDSSGNIIAAIECIRDITERMQLEAQVRQAQKMEAIGTLAGGIAHDFNNILASMVGYTELAMMNGDKADLQSGYLEQVMKACERAKNLVNQILSFSSQRDQAIRPMDVRIIAKEALKLLRASLPSTIRINPQISSVPATVMADPTQVHQIIMNLCTNAAQAMRENGGALDVYVSNLLVSEAMSSINPGLKTGPYVHLMVKDGGHGIEGAVIDKIFDPFFTTKRHQGGTGLGLSVVYGIVRSYDGVIQVKSDPGQGTTFNIYIPSTEDMNVAEERKEMPAIPRGQESILLVDDEELLVQAMEKYLQALGYDAVSLTSSSDALYMVQENPRRFDLMITDMTMPHMTGLKLSRKILAINPDIPIVLCTGYNESITEVEAKKNGIKEFVLKPITLQKMARLVRQVLDRP